MSATTVNTDEIAKFSKMADEWWDPNGKFKPLHKFHPVRLAYIREQAAIHFGKDMNARYPLEGLRVLDIGCGGGLLSEPMARLGAQVVGADAAERNITIARLHAEQSGVEVDYRATSAEALAEAGEQFDIVLNMEVVEHVDNVPLYMKSCADLVRPGGLQFVATLNRTLRARALAIFAAERVLRWLPVGTHEFEKFLTPEEITALVERNGMSVIDSTGVVYNPFQDAWSRSTDMGINYMILAQKPGQAS